MILFWVTTSVGVDTLMLKKHIRFLTLCSAALSETLCFSSRLFKAPPPEKHITLKVQYFMFVLRENTI